MTKKTFSFLIISGLPIFAVGLETVISSTFKARVRRIERARDGLDLCGSEQFDLVLLGVTQPERSGLDLHVSEPRKGYEFITKPLVSDVERGARNPSIRSIEELAQTRFGRQER